MGIKDNYSKPKGIIGSMIISKMNAGHTPMAEWTFAQFDIARDAKAVDIGCGGGMNVKRLLERCPEGRVYGVDISETSVRRSKKLNKNELGKRCEIYNAGADDLPFDDSSLDLATAFETIFYWPDLTKCFNEIHRVLKPGGRFIISNDSGQPGEGWEEIVPNMKTYYDEELKEYLEKAGFKEAEIRRSGNNLCIIGYK